MKRIRNGLITAALFIVASTLHAQVPQIINYQGRVLVGPTNFNGAGQFKFALVNSTGTSTYWSNDGTSTSGSEPSNAVSLTVSNGLYSVLLGDTTITNMTVSIPASVFNNSDVRLRVWFNDGTTGSQLLSPDQRIASVGYAVIAGTVPDGAITMAKLASGAVGSAQIANGGVGNAQIANGAVTAAKIGSSQVVKNVNGLTDAVTLAAGSNISITPSGNTLTLASTGGGSSIWSLNGTNAYYNGGNVGIGTSAPMSALDVRGNLLLETGGSPGIFTSALFDEQNRYLSIANSPATPTASGLKAGGILVSDDYFYANPGKNDLIIKGNVGIGTTSPAHRLGVIGGPGWTTSAWAGSLELANASAIAWQSNSSGNRFGIGHTNSGLYFFTTASNPGTMDSPANPVMALTDGGQLSVLGALNVGYFPSFGGGGAPVCTNGSYPNYGGQLVICNASSLRLKTNVHPFAGGLEIVRQLHPISFNWKENGQSDIGLGAEEVAKVAPLFTFGGPNGEVDGVRYERLDLLLINAVKEQQDQIEREQDVVKQQQDQIKAAESNMQLLKAANARLSARLRAVESRLHRLEVRSRVTNRQR